MTKKEQDPLFFQLFPIHARKGDLRKFALLQHAIETIAQEGWENTSHERIGKRAKMAKAHVAYYFKSKDDILELAIQYITAKAQQLTIEKLKSTTDWQSQLQAVIDGAFTWAREYPDHIAVLLVLFQKALTDRNFRKLNLQVRETGRLRLEHIVEFHPEKTAISLTIQNLITGLIVDEAVTGRKILIKPLFEQMVSALSSPGSGMS